MEEVYIGVLSRHDVFQFDGKYFIVVDDCFYIEGVPHVLAFCLGNTVSHLSYSAIISGVHLFISDCRVLYGGVFYED